MAKKISEEVRKARIELKKLMQECRAELMENNKEIVELQRDVLNITKTINDSSMEERNTLFGSDLKDMRNQDEKRIGFLQGKNSELVKIVGLESTIKRSWR